MINSELKYLVQLAVLLCLCVSTVQSNAQIEFIPSSAKRMDLIIGFTTLHHSITNDYETGLSNADKSTVLATMASAPYRDAGVQGLETACEYYMQTSAEDLQTDQLALGIANANQAELDATQIYFDYAYNSLSSAGKETFDEIVNNSITSSNITNSEHSQYYEKMRANGKDFLVRQYDKFCNSMDAVRERAASQGDI